MQPAKSKFILWMTHPAFPSIKSDIHGPKKAHTTILLLYLQYWLRKEAD